MRVYPRVCGGALCHAAAPANRWGLSPRVRGSPAHLAPAAHGDRSIPACAGEPAGIVVVTPSSSVYPRVCGGALITEYKSLDREGLSRVCGGAASTVALVAVPTGLSPRVRGSLLFMG